MNGLGTQPTTEVKLPSSKQVAKAYKVNIRTARRYLKQRTILKIGRKPKMDEIDLLAFLNRYLVENLDATQAEMADFLFQRTGKRLSQQAISWTLKKHNISHKKINYHYSEQLNHTEKIKHFLDVVLPSLPQPYILALDECGFKLNEAPRYGYSRQGFRANYRKPGQGREHHTLILCVQNINKQAVISYKLIKNEKKKIKDEKTRKEKIKKGTNALAFYNFLKDMELPTNETYYLLLDNSPIHYTTKELEKLGLSIEELARQKNIMLIYLPRYSPELNPVEEIFNVIKGYIRKLKPRTEEELRIAVEKIIAILNQQDLTKYFQDCFNYSGKERKKEKDWNNKKRSTWWAWNGKIPDPQKLFTGSLVYPSWRWMKLGARPTLDKMRSAVGRVKKHFEESLKLSI